MFKTNQQPKQEQKCNNTLQCTFGEKSSKYLLVPARNLQSVRYDNAKTTPRDEDHQRRSTVKSMESKKVQLNFSFQLENSNTSQEKLYGKEYFKKTSPLRHTEYRNPSNNEFIIPNLNLSSHQNGKFVPIKSNIKKILENRSAEVKDTIQDLKKETQIKSHFKQNSTSHDILRPKSAFEKQNHTLKEENQNLKKQVNFFNSSKFFNKKAKAISNLRDTIKKEDSELNELRCDLEIYKKKCNGFEDSLKQKDEKIDILISRSQEMEKQLKRFKLEGKKKEQNLKEQLNFMMNLFYELENKVSNHQYDHRYSQSSVPGFLRQQKSDKK